MPKQADDSDLIEDSDSDDLPSSLAGDDNEDIHHSLDADADADSADADALSLVEDSDNDDLIDLDDDIPADLIGYTGSDAESTAEEGEDDWSGIGSRPKRKRSEESNSRKRKKLRSLPTFASYEDYAKMIEEGPEDDI